MKIIITEKQYKKLTNPKIDCKCGHSWDVEKNDKHPHLCHMCGWDNNDNKYNNKELLNFWKNK
jgi:hypothetical protein